MHGTFAYTATNFEITQNMSHPVPSTCASAPESSKRSPHVICRGFNPDFSIHCHLTPKLGRAGLFLSLFILFVAPLLTVPTTASAQDNAAGPQARQITIEEAIQIALENNFQLKLAQNNLDLSRARSLSAAADFLPSLNGGLSQGRNLGRQFDNTTGEFGDFTINSFSASASSNITLFSGLENINQLRASRQETISREELLNRARENVIFNTATSFLQYLLNVQLLEIARENLQVSQRQLERIQAQVEVGARPLVDLLNQQSTLANSELQVVNRTNAVEQSRLALLRRMQFDPKEPVDFVRPALPEDQVVPKEFDLNLLLATAMENRSDLKSERASIEAARFGLRAAVANYFPSVSASASLRSSLNDRNPSPYNDQFFDQNISRNIGLSVSVPIFNRLNTRTAVVSQRMAYRNAQLSYENAELGVVQEVYQAYNDYVARVAEVESTQRAFKASERAYQTELQRYEIGASTLIELSQSQALFVQAQSNRVQALYSFIFQEKLLDYYLGNLSPDIGF